MTWVTFLAVLLLSYVAAIPVGTGAGGSVAVPEAVIEVTVWVDENGETLSVETAHPTATVDNTPTGLPPILAIPGLDSPNDLEPNLATDVNIKANVKTDHHPDNYNDHHVDHHGDHTRPQQNTRFFGISYSPYNADSTCKNQAQVNADIDRLTHYSYVRIYGVDCDQSRTVINAARRHGLKVFAGVYDLQNLHASLQMIIDAARPDLSILHTISIGNELINRGQSSVGDVVNAVNDARGYLRAQGYNGPVVTVDTFSKIFEHPDLCHVSDYCAANCHSFFDAYQTPANAGTYVRNIANSLSSMTGKRTIITESGWPHAGQQNGQAVPSPKNQRRAIEALRHTFWNDHDNLILFSAFDDLWKADNQWTFGAEKFWGIEKR
ncbi:glycoside hydrolase superfamily [Aspergillus karnatakaensis]|uniref:putative cell wall glucanase (Scw4) n=1 Tax=Aspergillus karnatakaensis TaxID=1810916 RepID=UPI003CCD1505